MAITLPFELPCAECRARPCAYYCEADAAYLCAPCDTLIHSANRLAGRHIRQTISYHPPDNACCPTAVPTSPATVEVTSSSYVPSMHQHHHHHHHHHHPHSFNEPDALVPDIANVTLSSNSTGSTSGSDLAYVAGQYVQREAAVLAASAARQWPLSAVLTSNSARTDVSRRLGVGNIECSVVSDAALKKKYTIHSNDDGNHSKREEHGEVMLHAKGCCAEMQEQMDTQKIEKRRERMAALQRFRSKRASRSFVKKVRYECRKQLADSRPRVKGRFVRKCEMSLYKKYGDDYRSYLHEMDSHAQKQDCVAPDLGEALHAALSDALDITDIVDMARPLSALS